MGSNDRLSRREAGIDDELFRVNAGGLFDLIHGRGEKGLVGGGLGDRDGANGLLSGVRGDLHVVARGVASIGLPHDPALRVGCAHSRLGASLLRFHLFEFVHGAR